jgi:hypothetical protein
MTKRWPWHLIGTASATFFALIWLTLFFHHLPVPNISTLWVIGCFLIAALLSIIAGYKASKWWFLVTACFGVTVVLVWIGQAIWEYGASPH